MPKKLSLRPPSEAEAFQPMKLYGDIVDREKQQAAEAREATLETSSGRFSIWSLISQTGFEKRVWRFLGNSENPWEFKQQVPMFGYILDFYSFKYMLCIEADGPNHRNQQAEDLKRDKVLYEKGIKTLRLTPMDFARNSKQKLVDVIEEFIDPKHCVGVKK